MSWLPKKTVVVPVDFSEQSVEAVRTALEFVSDPSQVHVLHVLVPLDAVSLGEAWGVEDISSRRDQAHEFMTKFLKDHSILGVTAVIRDGDPGIQIGHYAKNVSADLIVIPSHGRHGLNRLLLGSVAERVLRHAESPILMLRRTDSSW